MMSSMGWASTKPRAAMPIVLWNCCSASSPNGWAAALIRDMSANSRLMIEKPIKPAATATSTRKGCEARPGFDKSAVNSGNNNKNK